MCIWRHEERLEYSSFDKTSSLSNAFVSPFFIYFHIAQINFHDPATPQR
jgi:hypothetical protein